MDYNSFSSVSGAALTIGNFWQGTVRTVQTPVNYKTYK